jgi:hypothetical protein
VGGGRAVAAGSGVCDGDLEWSIAVLTRRAGLGGYDVERLDPVTDQDDTTAAAIGSDAFRASTTWS